MRLSLSLILVLFSLNTQAWSLNDFFKDPILTCGGNLELKDNFFYNVAIDKSEVEIHTLKDTRLYKEHNAFIHDAEVIGRKTYILSSQRLTLLAGQRESFKTYDIDLDHFNRSLGPKAMASYGDKIVIAHGRLGFSIFDTRTNSLVHQEAFLQDKLPDESMVVDVAIKNDIAFFLLDNFTLKPPKRQPAFRGIISYDLKNKEIINHARMYDAGATGINIDGDMIWINFNGFQVLAGYKFKDVLRKKKIKTVKRHYKLLPSFYSYRGGLSVKDNKLYTCVMDDEAKTRTKVIDL